MFKAEVFEENSATNSLPKQDSKPNLWEKIKQDKEQFELTDTGRLSTSHHFFSLKEMQKKQMFAQGKLAMHPAEMESIEEVAENKM